MWLVHIRDEVYNNFMKNRSQTIKEKLIKDIELLFGKDKRRIEHTKKVMKYAEELVKKEGRDWHILMPASILYDVGIKVSEEKYGSSAGHLQEKEDPGIARKLLLRLGLKMEYIDEICELIAHHHTPGVINTKNFKIINDADWLVNLKDEVKSSDEKKLRKMIDKVFLTPSGKKMAEKIYLSP